MDRSVSVGLVMLSLHKHISVSDLLLRMSIPGVGRRGQGEYLSYCGGHFGISCKCLGTHRGYAFKLSTHSANTYCTVVAVLWCVCVRACVRHACVRRACVCEECVRVCVRACVHVRICTMHYPVHAMYVCVTELHVHT